MIAKRGASLIILGVQILMLAGVAGKYDWDRRNYPRLWLRAYPVDPNSLTRGRYLSLRVQTPKSTQEQVIPFFIPEHVQDPSGRPGLYVEVTVPPHGPLRALRLGVLQDGQYKPLDLH